MKTIAYLGWYREVPIEVEVTKEDVKRGYIFVPCFECEGTGIWNYYPNGYIPTKKELRCTSCKGTGKVLINC